METRKYLDKVRHLIPIGIRQRIIQPLVYGTAAFLVDTGARVLGQHDPEVPPARLRLLGSLNYKAGGYEFLHYFTTLGGLAPDHHVLDIGCGIGSKAFAMARYLRSGRYEGIDVVPVSIEWCKHNISRRFPNFNFQVADIHNPVYNPGGRQSASEYRFPFVDGSFDFVILTSVFTHLLGADAQNYLREIGRLLRPGGRVVSTWFLIDQAVRSRMSQDSRIRQLVHPSDKEGVWIEDWEFPEASVGYDLSLARTMYDQAGLEIQEPIHVGSWSAPEESLSYQDLVVAVRR